MPSKKVSHVLEPATTDYRDDLFELQHIADAVDSILDSSDMEDLSRVPYIRPKLMNIMYDAIIGMMNCRDALSERLNDEDATFMTVSSMESTSVLVLDQLDQEEKDLFADSQCLADAYDEAMAELTVFLRFNMDKETFFRNFAAYKFTIPSHRFIELRRRFDEKEVEKGFTLFRKFCGMPSPKSTSWFNGTTKAKALEYLSWLNPDLLTLHFKLSNVQVRKGAAFARFMVKFHTQLIFCLTKIFGFDEFED